MDKLSLRKTVSTTGISLLALIPSLAQAANVGVKSQIPHSSIETVSNSAGIPNNDILEKQVGSSNLGKATSKSNFKSNSDGQATSASQALEDYQKSNRSNFNSLVASTTRCWDVPLNGEIKSLLNLATGTVAGTYSMTGHWCHNGERPTTWKVLNPYGETSTPGYNYAGHEVRYYNAGWEVRMVTQFRFTYGVPTPWGVVGKNQYACLQLRGGPGGRYSTSDSCNLN